MKNHSKETKNVSKNDYRFTQEKRKRQRFSFLFEPPKAAWGIIMRIGNNSQGIWQLFSRMNGGKANTDMS